MIRKLLIKNKTTHNKYKKNRLESSQARATNLDVEMDEDNRDE